MFLQNKLWLFHDIYVNVKMFQGYKHLKFGLKRMSPTLKLSESMKHSKNVEEKENTNYMQGLVNF